MNVLDGCWGHHQDGSDLMVNKGVLFDLVFNTVIKKIKASIKNIDKTLGDTCKNFDNCLRCETPYGRTDCKISVEIWHSARAFIEKKIEERKKLQIKEDSDGF